MFGKKNMMKRINLESFIIYLLMSDEVREVHKQKFQQWVEQIDAKDYNELGSYAHQLIADIAEDMAARGYLLTTNALMWYYKYPSTKNEISTEISQS